jgi:DNA-binding CsgD family transcriptional regulator
MKGRATAKEIARMLKKGMTSPENAEESGIKPSTVRTYIHDYQLK